MFASRLNSHTKMPGMCNTHTHHQTYSLSNTVLSLVLLIHWQQCLVGEDRQVNTGLFTRTCRVEVMLSHCHLSKQKFNTLEVAMPLQTQSSQDRGYRLFQKLCTVRIKLFLE